MTELSEVKPYFEILKKNRIFSGMTERELERGMKFFSAKISQYGKGEMLNVITEPLRSFGIVLEGLVHVCMADFEGQKSIMAAVSKGGGFGEALSFLHFETDVYIKAAEESKILWLNVEKVRNAASQSSEDNLFIQRFIADLAERALEMNGRVQIMSKRTIREKLLTMFSYFSQKTEASYITVPFDRSGMAVYLGVDRSSLSRELAKMQAEGIIRFSKNKFEIL